MSVLFYIGIMLISALVCGRIAKKLGLPNVTGYLIAGLVLGPYVLLHSIPFNSPSNPSREATITLISQTELSKVQCSAKFTQPVRGRAGPQPEHPHPGITRDNRVDP